MSERQIELTWRCSSCGHRNLGRHLSCTACGNPKDDSESYEMPPDPAQVASVTDEGLLAQARAGANWRCAYCGSDVRRRDGACAQCGATEGDGRHVVRRAPVMAQPLQARMQKRRLPLPLLALPVIALFACGVTSVFVLRARATRAPVVVVPAEPEFRDVEARVASAHWTERVDVQRFTIVEKEGFDEQKPKDATEVRPLGERVHHVDKVQEGTTTETYTETVTEMENETYTDQETCGQNCTPIPQTCKEKCTSNQNGFATCRTECSGGGQSCTPRYCSVTKTRMVPKPKQVQKTRTVPKMVDVPRMAPFFHWKQWDWQKDRSLEEKGDDFAPHWPSDEKIALNLGLKKGEKEREVRFSDFMVQLAAPDGTRHEVHPASREEYVKFENAVVTLRVHRYGNVEVASEPRKAP